MMNIIKRLLLCELLLLLTAAPAIAADDITSRALKLNEKHRYEEAAHLLRPALASMDGSNLAAANFALGMIYLNSAVLYSDFYNTALVIELDYLTKLSNQITGAASRSVDFYLGEAQLEVGKPAFSATYLRRFIEQVGAQSPLKAFADIELGIVYSRQKQTQKAAQQWSRLDLSKPELKAALAGAYAVTGAQENKPVLMADAALNEAKLQHMTPSVRMIRNLLRAYIHGGAPDKALELLNTNLLGDASSVEVIGSSKTINFYDLSLLNDIANTHLRAAVFYLEQAGRDEKLSATANYYLADAYLKQGNAELSLRSAASFLSQPKIPQQYRGLAMLNQASAQYMAGRRAEANTAWLTLAGKSEDDPAMLAAVMQACTQAKADCQKIEKLALAASESGEGKKYFALNAALGKYYLLQKDYKKAVLFMEAGRDKANKNKIEANDPLLLVGLAEAYYRNKKFSENLEIYFEIGKQYPVVRQIQEAMQGIYSMEQQSAGDVKIY